MCFLISIKLFVSVYAMTATRSDQDAYAKETIISDNKKNYINTEFGSAWLQESKIVSFFNLKVHKYTNKNLIHARNFFFF